MTITPSPDNSAKLAIPEAVVEALARDLAIDANNAGGDAAGVKKSIADAYWPDYASRAQRLLSVVLPHIPDRGYAGGIEVAAKSIDKRLRDYVEEHGSYDPDTGVTEFPRTGDEYCAELEEIAEAIRALAPPAPADNDDRIFTLRELDTIAAAQNATLSVTPSPIEDVPTQVAPTRTRPPKSLTDSPSPRLPHHDR